MGQKDQDRGRGTYMSTIDIARAYNNFRSDLLDWPLLCIITGTLQRGKSLRCVQNCDRMGTQKQKCIGWFDMHWKCWRTQWMHELLLLNICVLSASSFHAFLLSAFLQHGSGFSSRLDTDRSTFIHNGSEKEYKFKWPVYSFEKAKIYSNYKWHTGWKSFLYYIDMYQARPFMYNKNASRYSNRF